MAKAFAMLGKEKLLIEHHNVMYKLLGVCIDFINADGASLKLSRGHNFNEFCSCMRNNPLTCEKCNACDIKHAAVAKMKKDALIYDCHAGLTDIVLPLFGNDGKYLGSMTAGQFRLAGKSVPCPAKFKGLAKSCKTSEKDLRNMFMRTAVLSEKQTEGIVEYLQLVGKHLAGTYQNLLFMESVDTPEKTDLIIKYIKSNYRRELPAAAVAKKFFFTPNYFCRYFKKEVGINYTSYLNSYRVEKAKEMLRCTKLSISEIAFSTGFGSISQFNRIFLNIALQTPRDFRREHHK
jgi:AraC-like DNA-binding protein